MRTGLLILLVLLAPAMAMAQDAGDTEAARAMFERGLQMADQGDDESAERAFRASLALRYSVSASFNLAELLVRKGEVEEAVTLLDRVGEDSTAPPELRDRAIARAATLRARLNPDPPPDPDGDPDPDPDPSPTPTPTPEPSSGGVDGVALALALAVGLGATGAFAVASGLYWQSANETYDELELRLCAPNCDPELVSLGVQQQDFSYLFLTAAIVAAAATLTAVIVLVATSDDEAEVALRIGPGYAGLAGSF